MNRILRRLNPVQTGNYPEGEVLRREATTRRTNVSLGKERLVEYRNACFLDPRFRRQIRTGRHTVEYAQLG